MKLARVLLALSCVLGAALAQDAPPSSKDLRKRLGLVATRAIANFRSADSIEKNLKSMGLALHPQLVSLRLRIESALDRAEAAIADSDLPAAGEALDQAQALLDRYAARLGGG